MSESLRFKCIRCGHSACEVGKMYVAGGFWSKVFDVEGRKFSTVTCARCQHTEFYRANRNALGNIFDLGKHRFLPKATNAFESHLSQDNGSQGSTNLRWH